MRVLFWGTPAFAVPTLRALSEEGHLVVGAITQPDRPAGRGRELRASKVKEVARSEGIPVLEPERPRGEAFLEEIRALRPEVSVVVAYGHILRREVLDVPERGSINVHASLLPELRGAAPITWAIARGHTRTGVSVMRMVEAMDAGPVLLQREEPIGEDTTARDLTGRLSQLGAEALVEALALLSVGQIEERAQDDTLATFAPKVNRSLARLDWSRPAREVACLMRAMDDRPGAWSELVGVTVKLFRPEPLEALEHTAEPGTVLEASGAEGLVVAAGGGAVRIREAQPPGKRRMSAADWISGRGVAVGDRFV